jgi:hypothetical protein
MEAHAEGLEGRPRPAEVLATFARPWQLKPSRVITVELLGWMSWAKAIARY